MRSWIGAWGAVLLAAAAATAAEKGAKAPAAPPPAKSSSPPVLTLERVEHQGYCRMPGWLRYTVALRTFGDAFRGRIHIRAGSDFGVVANVPAASVKNFTIPVLIESQATRVLKAALEDESGKDLEVIQDLQPPVALKIGDVLVYLVSDERRRDWTDPSLHMGKSVFPRPKTVWLAPKDLPMAAADLEMVDLMVFSGSPPANPEMRDAVIGWIEAGGVLFLPDPRLFEGAERKAALEWLFPGFRQEQRIPADALLRKWGVYDYRTAFLETLGVRRAVPSPSGDGWIAAFDRGAGVIAFPTAAPAFPKNDPGAEEKIRAFWTSLFADVAGFENRSPPNPRRSATQISLVEPKLYRFFKSAQWPSDLLRRAQAGVFVYAGFAVLLLAFSLTFFIRGWQHLLLALGACVLGSGVLLLGFSPSKTAVGETLGVVQARSGESSALQWRLFHVASFTGSRIDLSLAPRPGERLYQVAYSVEDRRGDSVKWNFGDRVEIRGIRLEESGRFLALGTCRSDQIGSLSARWESPDVVVIKNEIRPSMVRCALIRDGLFLPLKEFKFGDPPRTVDLGAEWIPLARYLEALVPRNALTEAQDRVIRAFFDEFYAAGETVFVGFFVNKSQDFQSRDLLMRDTGLYLVAMSLPPAPSREGESNE
jgi:hypothetical protein